MTLFDTNVLIYAMDPDSPFYDWAARLIVDEAMKGDAAVNAISIAEVCVGAEDPNVVVDDILDWGIQLFDVPTDVVVPCAVAYRVYRQRRFRDSGRSARCSPSRLLHRRACHGHGLGNSHGGPVAVQHILSFGCAQVAGVSMRA